MQSVGVAKHVQEKDPNEPHSDLKDVMLKSLGMVKYDEKANQNKRNSQLGPRVQQMPSVVLARAQI